jgi:hypothetical protein
MDKLESKLLAEALNKIDKLTQCVVILQDQIRILDENFKLLADTAHQADSMLADQITEVHASMVAISSLMLAVKEATQ